MDAVLIILGILGLGAMAIAAYVFTVAARNYVNDNNQYDRRAGKPTPAVPGPIQRSASDRRQQPPVNSFPITVNGALIEEDRRQLTDRRLVA